MSQAMSLMLQGKIYIFYPHQLQHIFAVIVVVVNAVVVVLWVVMTVEKQVITVSLEGK